MKFLGKFSKRVKVIVLVAVILAAAATATVFGSYTIRSSQMVGLLSDAAAAETAGDGFAAAGAKADADASFSEAEKLYMQCLSRDVNNETALTGVARVLGKQNRWREASFRWSRAITLNPFKKEYKEAYIKALLNSVNYPVLSNYINSLPADEQRDPKIVELKIFAEICCGQMLKAQELLLPLADKTIADSPKLRFAQFRLDSLTSSKPDEVRKQLEQFAQGDDPDVKLVALVMLAEDGFAKRNPSATEEENAETLAPVKDILLRIVELNPGEGLPILGNFYFLTGDFVNAVDIYTKSLKYGISSRMAMRYGEALAEQKNLAQLKQLAKYFRGGTKTELMTGYYLNMLAAFLERDYKVILENLKRLDNSFETPVALMIALDAYVHEGNVPKVVSIIKTIQTDSRYSHLFPFAFQMSLPLLSKLYDDKQLDQLAPLAAALQQPDVPNLLLTRIVLLDALRKGSLDYMNVQEALKAFPKDPAVLDIASIYALQRGKFDEMLAYVTRNQETGNNSVSVALQRVIALEGSNRMDEADAKFRELVETMPDNAAMAKNYLSFSVRNRRTASLDWLIAKFQSVANPQLAVIVPLAMAEKEFIAGKLAAVSENLKKVIALNVLSERNPEDIELLYRIAFLFASADAIDQAIDIYERLENIYPDRALILLNMSELYAAKQDKAKALSLAERAWRMRDQWSTARACYGLRLFEAGDYEQALRMLDPLMNRPVEPRVEKAWADALEIKIKQVYEKGDYNQCLADTTSLLRREPANRIGLEYTAKANEALKRANDKTESSGIASPANDKIK